MKLATWNINSLNVRLPQDHRLPIERLRLPSTQG